MWAPEIHKRDSAQLRLFRAAAESNAQVTPSIIGHVFCLTCSFSQGISAFIVQQRDLYDRKKVKQGIRMGYVLKFDGFSCLKVVHKRKIALS